MNALHELSILYDINCVKSGLLSLTTYIDYIITYVDHKSIQDELIN